MKEAAKIGCLSLIGLFVLLAIIGSLFGGGGVTGNDDQVLQLVGQRATCLSHLDINEAAMVSSSDSTDDLAVVRAFTKNNLTGADKEYRFGVPLNADGTPRGTVVPGNPEAADCLG